MPSLWFPSSPRQCRAQQKAAAPSFPGWSTTLALVCRTIPGLQMARHSSKHEHPIPISQKSTGSMPPCRMSRKIKQRSRCSAPQPQKRTMPMRLPMRARFCRHSRGQTLRGHGFRSWARVFMAQVFIGKASIFSWQRSVLHCPRHRRHHRKARSKRRFPRPSLSARLS